MTETINKKDWTHMKTIQDIRIARERDRLVAAGCRQVSISQLRQEFAALGYKLCDPCNCIATDCNTGETFPCRGFSVQEADTGVSAWHYQDARRDSNYHAMQLLRRDLFAVHCGRIVTV